MNRPKVIGTRGETAVVNLAHKMGFPDAERLALRGSDDWGDIRLLSDPLVILEVKSGKTAQNASWSLIRAWMHETKLERDRARRQATEVHGFLITQRRGYGIGRVEDWCLWTLPDDPIGELEVGVPVMLPLGGFLWMMRERWNERI